MVTRSVFYVEGNKIYRQDILIEWDLGFDKEAKHEYIKRIQQAASGNLRHSVDVTTASPDYTARSLSPFFVKDGDMNIEDVWALNKQQQPQIVRIPGAFDFIYLNAIPEALKEYVYEQTGFIDVFFNPDKAYNTQAKSLAILQLLNETGNLCKLENLGEFVEWYRVNCVDVVIK